MRFDALTDYCPACGSKNIDVRFHPDPLVKAPHYGRFYCNSCRRFQWIGKERAETDRQHDRRKHKAAIDGLRNILGVDYCQACMRKASELVHPETINGHHVIEFRDGGKVEVGNVWFLCTSCHEMVAWLRKNVGRRDPYSDDDD